MWLSSIPAAFFAVANLAAKFQFRGMLDTTLAKGR